MIFLKPIKYLSSFALVSFCTVLNVAHAGPKIESWSLDNGAQVYWVNSPSLPIVDVQVNFDAGSRRDPKDKISLSGQVAMMSDKGVSANSTPSEPAMNENEITDAWLDLGAMFGVDSGKDEMGFSLRTLNYPEVMPKAVHLASRIIGSPSFPETILKRDQERMAAALKESLTQPGTVAARTYSEQVYSGHPYGNLITEDNIFAITTEDLEAFHNQYLLPCHARISIVGDVTREQANDIASQLLSQLPQSEQCPTLATIPEVPKLSAAIEKDIPFNAAQAQIIIGQPGIKRNDPDFLALVVANHILGGNGFSSKLMQEVREKRGLTYGIYSAFSPSAHAGAFTISLKTRPDQAEEAVKISLQVLNDFIEQGPTPEELAAAKANLLGSFPLMFDSNRKLLAQVANIARNDLPLDYLDQWPALIEAVSAEDVKAAMQKAIQPDHLVTVVVGAQQP